MNFRHGEIIDAAKFRERIEAGAAKRSKYQTGPAADRRWRGRTYASLAEKLRAQQLHGRPDLQLVLEQSRFRLGCDENVYIADFVVVARDGTVWAEDVKGASTAAWRRQRRLWLRYGPIPLRVLDSRSLRVSETLEPGGANG